MSDPGKSNSHENHRERMRQRFLDTGGKGFAPHELLEMLLFYAKPRVNTNPLAHDLLEYFGGVSGLLGAQYDDILNVDGAGSATAMLIKLLSEFIKAKDKEQKVEPPKFSNYDEVGRYLVGELKGEPYENLVYLFLDAKERLVHTEKVCSGSATSVTPDMAELLSLIVRKRPAKMIIAHNHPDGDPNPSRNDKMVSRLIESKLDEHHVELKEHYIVTDDVYIGLKYVSLEV